MINNFYREIVCFSASIAFFTGCQFSKAELKLAKLHKGEEVLCTSHPNLIGYPQGEGDIATLWINVQVLKAPWEAVVHELRNSPPKPLQDRSSGTKVAIFSVKKSVDSRPFTSHEPYQLVKRDLIEGENLTIGKKNWQVVMIGLDGVRVNGNEQCRSGFVYIKEVN
jgi:hypothetical protein